MNSQFMASEIFKERVKIEHITTEEDDNIFRNIEHRCELGMAHFEWKVT